MGWRYGQHVAWQVIADEVVIVDLAAGKALGLNATGSLVWPLLEARDEGELTRLVVDRFHVDEASARADLEAFLADLEQRGLITRQESLAAAPAPAACAGTS